jgi:hypothetical protein
LDGAAIHSNGAESRTPVTQPISSAALPVLVFAAL